MAYTIGRPDSSEFSNYAQRYVDLVPGDDPLEVLTKQAGITRTFLEGLDEGRAGTFRYAEGKWTAKEVVGHLSDTERIFAYRALRVGRGDSTPLPGFEQDDYVSTSCSNARSLADLLAEWTQVRAATIALFRSFSEEAWARVGVVNAQSQSVRGIAYTMAGHELHHFRILQEKYAPV